MLDGLLGLLCGAKTISQSHVTIRVDPAVQRACGRTGCAEPSTMARTLQASTTETVAQLERVSWYDLKRYGQTPHQRFAERLLWIDSLPYTFFLLNDDMKLNRNWQFLI